MDLSSPRLSWQEGVAWPKAFAAHGALESAADVDLVDAEETGEAERIRQSWRPLRAA